MKTRWKILIGVLVSLAALVIVAAIVADVKYEAIRPAPAVSHEAVAPPDATLRVVAWPPRAQEYLARHVLQKLGVSEGVVDKVMPYEAAVLLSPDLGTGEVGVSLFVNEQRLGPVVADFVKPADLQRAFPPIAWAPEGMVRERR
ncbi:MAG: hypothetical protein JXR94_04945, partial [Candidatus Hydrogenedentes bacterium]|nr:hypothetical protein [Candidatus Hydrogenedentota bacterium]